MIKKFALTLLASIAFGAHAAPPAAPAAPAVPAPAAGPLVGAPIPPATLAAARELLTAMHYTEMATNSLKQMSQAAPINMRRQNEAAIKNDPRLNDAQRKEKLDKMEKELPRAVAVMQQVLNDPTLIDELYRETLPLYARHFSPEEMKQMAAFYRTPTGQKVAQLMPQITLESMQTGQRVTMPRLQKAMQAQAPTPAKN
jgi:hypothetical protein